MTRNVSHLSFGLLSSITLVFCITPLRHAPAQEAPQSETTAEADGSPTGNASAEIDELINDLEDGELQSRRDAAWQLGNFGAEARPAVAALAKAADDRDPQVSNGALHSLGRIGPPAREAIPQVVEQLRRGNSQHRYRAAFALGHLAQPDHEAFAQGLRSDSDSLRIATAVAVGWLGPEGDCWSSDVVELLDTDDDEDVQQVLIALSRLGEAAVPALRESLSSNQSSPQLLARSCVALEQIETRANAAAKELADLASNDAQDIVVRAAAVRALAAVAPDSPETRSHLERAFRDNSPRLQQAALNAAIKEPAFAVSLQSEIVKLLDAGPESANLAALAMGRIGKAAVPIVPELLARLGNENADAITNTISKIGPLAIPAVMRSAAENQISVRQAVRIIQRMGPAAEASLTDAMKSQKAEQRAVAYQGLGELDMGHEQIVAGLDDPKPIVRAAAAHGLAAGSHVMAEAIPRLKELAADRDSDVRIASLSALIAWKVSPDELVTPLEAALQDPSPTVRASSAEVVGRLTELPTPLVRGLAKRLADDQQEVRLAAVTALAATDHDVRAAVPELIEATQDPAVDVVNQAARALGNIDELPPEGLDAVARLLRHEQTSIKEAALSALSRLGPAALPYRQALEELSHDEASSLRVASVKALVKILPDTQPKLALLIQSLDDPDWSVRREMMSTVADLGEEAVPAVPRLLELMRNREDADGATSALRRIDDAPPEAVPLLLEILESDRTDRRQRYYALHLLRKVGPAAGDALPVLREMRDASDGRLRDFLGRTIRDIEEDVAEEADRGA